MRSGGLAEETQMDKRGFIGYSQCMSSVLTTEVTTNDDA